MYQEAEAVILQDLPGFYLYGVVAIWAMNKKVQDFGYIVDQGAMHLSSPWKNTWLQR